jgi:hypothetical protein
MALGVDGYDEVKLYKIAKFNYKVKQKIGSRSCNLHLLLIGMK